MTRETVLDKDAKLVFPHILVIDASAGSGKTHTLAQRFVQFLLSDRIKYNDLINILAITFTKNAAREMKQRVIKWLKILALGMTGEDDPEQIHALLSLKPAEIRARAAAGIDLLISRYSDFHVQTIDSFMSRILRSSADELGMPPDNDITGSYAALSQEAMSDLFARFGTTIPHKEIDRFLDLFNQSQTSSFNWRPAESLERQFETFLEQEGKVLEEVEFSDPSTAAGEKYSELCALYQEVRKLGLEGSISAWISRSLGNGDFEKFDRALYFKTLATYDCGLTRNGIERLLAAESGPELAKRIRAGTAELADLISLAMYAPYGPLYRHFKSALESVKRRTATIHFDDINKQLSRYMKRELIPEIYYRLGDVLYHFLLDEFQDTDRVQWQNIDPLLEDAYAKGGTLFVVGDMKQAVYQFRKADYRIMRRLVRCIRGELGPACLPPSVRDNALIKPLEHNFRSGGKILDYVDSIFKKRLKEFGPELLSEDRTGLTDYDQRVPEDMRDHGYVKTVIIPKSGEAQERKVLLDILNDVTKRFARRDIAILAFKNEQIVNIVSWLTEAGVWAASFSSLDIRKRKVIMEIVNLLRFLDAPIDDQSFAAFITGDIFLTAAQPANKQLTREALFDLILEKKLSRNSTYLYTYFRDHLQFSDLWSKYFEKLYGIVGYYPLYDLVAEIYKTFNIFGNFANETGFFVRFLEAIVSLEARGMGDIKDLVSLVEEEGEESALEILLPDYLDAVKVMTFHKAKGLGFPVVINMFYDGAARERNMFFDLQQGKLLARYSTVAMRECNQHLDKIAAEAALDSRIQTLNLMYVALTRAKSELYNLVIRNVDDEAPVEKPTVEEAAAKKKARTANKTAGAEKKLIPIDLLENAEMGKRERAAVTRTYPEPTPAAIPKPTVYKFAKDEDKKWSVERRLETQRGDLFHQVLYGVEYVGPDIEQVLTDLITAAIQTARLPYEPEETRTILLRFLNQPQVKSWFEKKPGRRILRETDFVNELGALYRMDRIVLDPDQVILVDFKIGGKMPFYAAQMKNYREILAKVYTAKPIKCYWAYIDSSRVEEAS